MECRDRRQVADLGEESPTHNQPGARYSPQEEKMCSRISPELRARMSREMVEEIRKWFREWRRRNAVILGTLGLKGAVTGPTDAPRGH